MWILNFGSLGKEEKGGREGQKKKVLSRLQIREYINKGESMKRVHRCSLYKLINSFVGLTIIQNKKLGKNTNHNFILSFYINDEIEA